MVENIVNTLWNFIISKQNIVPLLMFSGLLTLIDLLYILFMTFSGIIPNEEGKYLINSLLKSKQVWYAYLGVVIIAILMMSIFIITSNIKKDTHALHNPTAGKSEVSKSKLLSRTIASFIVVTILPMFLVVSITLSNQITLAVSDLLNVESGMTLGEQIFDAAMVRRDAVEDNLERDEAGNIVYVARFDGSDDIVYVRVDENGSYVMDDKGEIKLYKKKFQDGKAEFRRAHSSGTEYPGIPTINDDGTPGVKYDVCPESYARYYKIPEAEGGKPIRISIDDEALQVALAKEKVTAIYLLDPLTINKFYTQYPWSSGLGVLCSIVIVLSFFITSLLLVERIASILILYVIAPIPCAFSIHDEGQRFNIWKDTMAAKILSVAGTVFAFSLFGLIVNSNFIFVESLLNAGYVGAFKLLTCVGCSVMVMNAGSLLSSLVGAGVGASEASRMNNGLRMVFGAAMSLAHGASFTANALKGSVMGLKSAGGAAAKLGAVKNISSSSTKVQQALSSSSGSSISQLSRVLNNISHKSVSNAPNNIILKRVQGKPAAQAQKIDGQLAKLNIARKEKEKE